MGSLEDMRDGSLVERTRTHLCPIDYGYLNFESTEDDDDDDDEATQNKLVILLARDGKIGTHAATCLREKGVSEYASSWLVSLLRRFGYRRAIL